MFLRYDTHDRQWVSLLTASQLFCVLSQTEFEEEFLIFDQHPAVAPLAWLSLLFVMLALACLTEEHPDSIRPYRLLSMRYDRIAWHSLSIDNPPFQPSVTAWKAMVLLIYGRLHRGENVSEDLRLAYNMANTIDCDSCCRQSIECEKHGILWIGLEMLCSMNRQAFGNAYEHGNPQKKGFLVNVYGKDFVGSPRLRMGYQIFCLVKDRFDLLHAKLLELSDFIADSTQDGFLSAWSLLGLLGRISYLGASIEEFSGELSASDAQSGVGFVQLKILQYLFQYLLLCAYMPFLEKYFSGDTSSHTLFYAAKCVESAQAIRVIFRSLSDNQPCKAFTWYFRGFGEEYVAVAERTLKRTNYLRYG